MASTKFYLDCRRAKPGQPSVLKIAIGHGNKTSYISLDAKLFPNQWDSLKERVKDHPEKQMLNAYIYEIKQNVDAQIIFLTREQKIKSMSAKDIPLESEGTGRPYCMLEQTASGEYAQADFGEKWVDDEVTGHKKKVYFFVLLMSRWRMKFIWLSDEPFTSELAAYAHELAFEFFGGVPQKIVYDQDKVLLNDENMGDYILTHRFKALVGECGFMPVFCRKADPESKGKVENTVKYVKNNFLAGYSFRSMEGLRSDCLRWMETTANGLAHATTGKIPAEMFEQEEKFCLMPYKGTPSEPKTELPTYMLRKDNTISYRGCFYAVLLGTYKGPGSSVRVNRRENKVEIYSTDTGKLLVSHPFCTERGRLVTNTSCRRNPDQRIVNTPENWGI